MDTLLICSILSLLVSAKGDHHASTDDGWSMNVQAEVRAIEGYPVVLPCTFSHPQHIYHPTLQAVWRLGHGAAAIVLYRCTSRASSQTCEPRPRQDQRYRLEGNPRQHDLSLRINSAALQDNGRYYCRVEVGHEHHGYEDKMGTRLRVEAAPRILAMSVEGNEESGYRALCRVQGSPLPDIQWFGPNEILDDASVGPQAQNSPAHQIVSQLADVVPGQQYTCSASNPLGKERATLYVLPPRQEPLPAGETSPPLLLLLSLSLGAKVILLVGLWGALGRALPGLRCHWK
ncbi:V-set and Ig domain-containing protein [Lampris incognitus]|uniref:V-set and Ig domain-containing protein n=1 Tax=Lampris incognitus TaxID=2546036 RepID=UPI0024B4F165|nr:V-set and Ig domain-containing protein [Lampris incognitus]